MQKNDYVSIRLRRPHEPCPKDHAVYGGKLYVIDFD